MECRHCLGHKATARSQFRVLFAVEMAGSYCFVGLPASGLVWCHVSIMDVEKEEREKKRMRERERKHAFIMKFSLGFLAWCEMSCKYQGRTPRGLEYNKTKGHVKHGGMQPPGRNGKWSRSKDLIISRGFHRPGPDNLLIL